MTDEPFDPTHWQILAVALMRRLGGKVELSRDEIEEARALLDPIENQTLMVSYSESQLTPWPPPLTVELRSRPRTVPEALSALADEIRGWIPEESSIFDGWTDDRIRRDDEPSAH